MAIATLPASQSRYSDPLEVQALFALATENTLIRFAALAHEACAAWLPRVADWALNIEAQPAVPGYQDLFENEGMSRLGAHILAKTIVRCSVALPAEYRVMREGTSLILKTARSRSTERGRNSLIDYIENKRLFNYIYGAAHDKSPLLLLRLSDLHQHLVDALRGSGSQSLLVIAAKNLRPLLPQTRGLMPSKAHFAHSMLLELESYKAKPKVYTYSDAQGDYIDDLTKATRTAFADPTFRPTSVRA